MTHILRHTIASCLLALSVTLSAQDFGFGGNQQSDMQAQYSEKISDINYAGDTLKYHNLDVYLPKTTMPKAGYPVIIHIYGSAWYSNNAKGWADINTICAALLDAGYAVVCPNHRSSADAKYPAQIQDIKAVVRWIRGNARKYHFDTRFIGTSGFSSGAHLASLCAATNGVKTARSGSVEMDIEGSLGNNTKEKSTVNACCEWSGPIDLMNMDCDGIKKKHPAAEDHLMDFPYQGHEDAYNLLSPIYYLNAKTVPIFVNHGEKDNVVPHCQGELFWNALQQAGVKGAQYHSQPDGGHGFNMYTRENLSAMIAFFDKARGFVRKTPVASLVEPPLPEGPELEYVCELKVTCDKPYTVGHTSHGERIVIPITGGTFQGPKMKGIVLPGGADYQLISTSPNPSQGGENGRNISTSRTELEAIYSIKTDDGVNIHIRNCGLLVSTPKGEGQEGVSWYFRTAPKFEAPTDSKYNWLNNAIFVCVPEGKNGYISLKVWKVK